MHPARSHADFPHPCPNLPSRDSATCQVTTHDSCVRFSYIFPRVRRLFSLCVKLDEPSMGRSGQDPHGFHYYNSLVRVECGDKEGAFMHTKTYTPLQRDSSLTWFIRFTGCFTGGHYDRRGYDSDLHIICSCSDCQAQSAFTRILCRHWEEHAGRLFASKSLPARPCCSFSKAGCWSAGA